MIKTTVVGSYPMISWLAANPTQQNLTDATSVVLKAQELAGIDVVADGELYRFDVNHPETNGMIEYFIRPLTNIRTDLTRSDVQAFRDKQGMQFRTKPAGVVDGPLGEGSLNLVDAYRRVRPLTNSRLKFTVTGPHMLSKTLLDNHYGTTAELAGALGEILATQIAEIDSDVLQVDEANIPGSPQEAEWAADAANVMLRAVKGESAVHVCFGNYGGQSIQKGTWEALLTYMNRLEADHLVLEFAHRGYDELAQLKALKDDVKVGLGVVDIKSTVVETPDSIAGILDNAFKVLGPDRVEWIHPDCGFWMLKRSIADAKMSALVKGRDLFEGRS